MEWCDEDYVDTTGLSTPEESRNNSGTPVIAVNSVANPWIEDI